MPPSFSSFRRGFTSIEVLIVLAILGIAAGLILPVADTSLQRDDLEVAAVSMVDAIRSAQSSSMGGRDNVSWGVHFSAGSFVVFSGGTYSDGAETNEPHDLGGRVRISDVSLLPGVPCNLVSGTGNCDLHFADPGGRPSESGTITLTNQADETRTVTINSEGMTEQNQ